MKGAKSAEQYLIKNPQWSACLVLLRELVLSISGFTETIKWGIPVYEYKGKNVAGIAAFKAHVALWFYQGALLEDRSNVLMNAQEEITVAMRQWRFKERSQIEKNADLIVDYLKESIQNQDSGLLIKPMRAKPLVIPGELKNALDKDSALLNAFEKFTLSKQREFTFFIGQAKRLETKMRRLEKIIPMIFSGIGLNDNYR